jgi:NAD(P)-dependent dehydrogenase (short-subunit alcohol dehydrogenase family)
MYSPTLFKNKIALVTGGRSGIGFAIAKQLLQLGASVMILSRKEAELKQAAESLSEFGICKYIVCDIRITEDIQKVAAKIQIDFGRLDILVNNAGGQFPILAEYLNDKGWNAVLL